MMTRKQRKKIQVLMVNIHHNSKDFSSIEIISSICQILIILMPATIISILMKSHYQTNGSFYQDIVAFIVDKQDDKKSDDDKKAEKENSSFNGKYTS